MTIYRKNRLTILKIRDIYKETRFITLNQEKERREIHYKRLVCYEK